MLSGIYKLTVAVHASYYVLTGLWPILHIKSFMAVTGPKEEIWLVKTVGVLVIAIGIAVFSGIRSKNFSVIVLGIASCTGLALIDVYYVMDGTLRWVYLLDALAETMLLTGWLLSAFASREEKADNSIRVDH